MNALKRKMALMLAVCTAVLAGCAVTPSKVDPLEPWNRAMYSVHTAVDDAVIKPVAKAYVQVWPEPVRTSVSNFFGNIDDFFTGVNDVLQGNGNRAGDAFGRVLLNSTFGLGGIFDLASMIGITKDRNDFGLTLGKWGAPEGAYLFIPLFGPTTVRDGTGVIVRIYLSPTGYIDDIAVRNAVWGLNYLDSRAQLLQSEGVLETAALDKYRFLRNAYLKNRRYQLYEGKPPPDLDEE
jgi:phospholipid-binding lipoprotein MlaA